MRLDEFEASDYEIRNRFKLDKILVKLCDLVIDNKNNDPKKFGWVGAAVLDPKNKLILRTAEHKDGKWIHAERNAIDAFEKQYGEITPGSIIITTLTPCNEKMHDRYGSSCTDYINQSNVRKVYCGYKDPSQNNEHNEFTEEVTENSDIVRLCKKLADTFL